MKAVIGQTTTRQVAFVGPFGVGKTTAVRSVSDTPVVNTEVPRTGVRPGDSRVERKLTTTVGLDYGEWFDTGGAAIAVLGTPGQNRFGVVRRSAVPRGTTVVLWLFGQTDYALDEAAEWLDYLAPDLVHSGLVVAVTRLDQGGPVTLDAVRALVTRRFPAALVLAADPRDRDDVVTVLGAAREVAAAAATEVAPR